MKVYSLYLSSLSGTTQQAIFSATASGTVLTITSVVSGTVQALQYVNINGSVNQIASLGTGTGGNGTYNLTNNIGTSITTATSFISYKLNPNKYSPTNLTVGQSLSNLRFTINWKEIFGNRNGECRCRIRYISNSGTNVSWISNTGSIRASFQSSSANNTNLCNLGCVRPQNDYTGTGFTYLDCDTTTSNGVSVVIPNSNQDFIVSLLNANETYMTTVPDYQIWFYFDCDDEDPLITNDLTIYNSNNIVPSIYSPR